MFTAQTLGVALATVSAVMLAAQALVIRVATQDGRVTDALLVVLFVNTGVIAIPSLAWFYPQLGLTPFSVAVFVGAGLVGTVMARSLYYLSITRLGASRTEPIKSSQPLHATLIAVLVLNEHVGPLHAAGIGGIVLGLVLVSWETGTSKSTVSDEFDYTDLVLPLAAAFLFGVEPTFVKLGFREGTPTQVGLSLKILAALLGFVAYLALVRRLPSRDDLRGSPLGLYVLAGVVNSAFLYAYYAGLQYASVSIVVPLVQTSPLLVAVGSFFLLSDLERVDARIVSAAMLVVCGAITITLFG